MKYKSVKVILLLFLLSIFLFNCQFFKNKEQKEELTTSERVEDEEEEIFTEIRKHVYIIKKEVHYYKDPKGETEKEWVYYLGDRLNVTAQSAHFYKVEDNETRFVRKEDTGNYEDIILTKKELEASSTFLIENDKDAVDKEVTNFSRYFSVSLISHEEYLTELKNKYVFLTEDTLAITKKDKMLILPCKDTLVKLKDIDPQDESVEDDMDMAIYDYIGKVDLLNQYVIRGSYFEAGDYFFIDKDTGKKTSLIGKPFLSPDGKHIVCLNMEEMDGVGYISLYEMVGKTTFKLKTKVEAIISYWLPYDWGKEPIFFSKKGYLYASMNPSGCYYDSEGANSQRKYVKIRIK